LAQVKLRDKSAAPAVLAVTPVTDFRAGRPQNQGMSTSTLSTLKPEQTVGQIAAEFPASVRVFEK